MSTIDNYLLADGTYPDEWPQAACDLVDILREHEDRDRALITKLEAKLVAVLIIAAQEEEVP